MPGRTLPELSAGAQVVHNRRVDLRVMTLLLHRVRRSRAHAEPAGRRVQPAPDPCPVVAVGAGLDHLAPRLADELPFARVVSGHPAGTTMFLVPAMGAAAVAFLRTRYPAGLLVVVANGRPVDSVALLAAGADLVVDAASTGELVAYLKALLRRVAPPDDAA